MIEIILIAFSIFACFFFAGIEMALISIHRPRLRHMRKSQNKNIEWILNLLNDPQKMIITVLIGNNFFIITGSILAEHLMGEWFGLTGKIIAFIFMSFVLFVFSELLSKILFRTSPEYIALSLTPFIKLSFRIITPFEKIFSFFIRLIFKITESIPRKNTYLTREEFLTMINERTKEGVFSENEKKLIISIIEMKTKGPEKIMTQWKDVQSIKLNDPVSKLMEICKKYHLFRVPVMNEELPEKIIGMVNIRDVLYSDKASYNIKDIIKPVAYVNLTNSLTDILKKLQNKALEMAVVYDKEKPAGLVTLSSLLQVF